MTDSGALDELLVPLLADPPGTAILVDFDGTISPIVVDPAAATALPEAVDVLHDLASGYGVVAVVSGRPASFLVERLALSTRTSGLFAVGLYGLEQADSGGHVTTLAGEEWRSAVAGAAARAEAAAPAGVAIEKKGLSVTLHWREVGGGVAAETTRLASRLAEESGLSLRHGRMSVELVPPVGMDKRAAVERLCQGRRAAFYAGDDLGDLEAFAALDAVPRAVRVAVASDEAPPELLAAADAVVDGPPGVVDLLQRLAAGL